MAFKVRYKRGVNIKRVIAKIAIAVLTLYVGGTILNAIGGVLNNTMSPFYPGLSLIGYTVGTAPTNGSHWTACDGVASYVNAADPAYTTCVSATNGSGILTVVGLIAIASVVMEFVSVSF